MHLKLRLTYKVKNREYKKIFNLGHVTEVQDRGNSIPRGCTIDII